MDITNIINDMCKNYPSFKKKDADIQILPYSETGIFFFYKDREFFYTTQEGGVLMILYNGTIQSVYAPKDENGDNKIK